ncbi:MAG: PAS domain-containing protein [Alphaproteobacteria bacterium]|nr:PAS domain-containing protein [Alphaproteobacteria bacterium]MBV9540545.1 PAS domain-containing protein [Alphaproteobacteria bacterium]
MSDAFADSIVSERLKTVYAVWKEQTTNAIGAQRDDITPAKLRGAMPWTFLIEAQPTDFRFAFAGERIQEFMGTRLLGQQLSTLLGNHYFAGMNRFFRACADNKRPLHREAHRSTYPGKEHFDIEVIVMPLSSDGETVSHILGAFDTWRAGTHT